jgi:hypothetical protein
MIADCRWRIADWKGNFSSFSNPDFQMRIQKSVQPLLSNAHPLVDAMTGQASFLRRAIKAGQAF